MMKSQQLKLGLHRKNRRVWLDNRVLLKGAGFQVGFKYDVKYCHLSRVIFLTLDAEGARKVAKKNETDPIIDLNSTKVGWALGDCSEILVEYNQGIIEISPIEEKERSMHELASAFKTFEDKA